MKYSRSIEMKITLRVLLHLHQIWYKYVSIRPVMGWGEKKAKTNKKNCHLAIFGEMMLNKIYMAERFNRKKNHF